MVLVALWVTACQVEVPGELDAGVARADAGSLDAGPVDAGGHQVVDAGDAADAGPADAGHCGPAPVLSTSALRFDGTGGVSMGPAPDLGASRFTLEAWVRRDGDGREASTGVGGIRHVPIITKGRGESDGTNVDCNYALGFVGEVLGVDFEDAATGANHPLLGTTQIPRGRWTHVAATFDGSALRLYVYGRLDAERAETATPRFDSIQHFGLGVALNSTGVRAGALLGALDEVRVYTRALSQAELRAQLDTTAPSLLGLAGHFHLDEGDGEVLDASGHENHGDGVAAGFVAPGARLDQGAAPRFEALTSSGGGARQLQAQLDAAEGTAVTFYARALTAADDFTIVVLPDSQYYTRNAAAPDRPQADDPSYFSAQTQWAVDHRHSDNVVGVFHVGDIINNADVPAQWQRASAAMEILESVSEPGYPDGIPYGLVFGNHDQFPRNQADATVEANRVFGVSRYQGRSYYGGNYDGDNDESWVRFRAGDLDIIVLNFQYNETPSSEVLAWGRRVFESRPAALGIVASHYIVTGGGNFSDHGSAIYGALRDVDNVQLMASGHVSVDARRTDTHQGNVIHSMLSDYQRCFPDPADPTRPLVGEQSRTNGGAGFMRIWRFSPSEQKLHVRSYSPKLNASYTDARNQFSLDVDLKGAGTGAFLPVGTAAVSGGRASVALPLQGGAVEWYAEASDCVHQTRSGLQLAR